MVDYLKDSFYLEATMQNDSVNCIFFNGHTEIGPLLASHISNRSWKSLIIDHGSALRRDGVTESGMWSNLGSGRIVARTLKPLDTSHSTHRKELPAKRNKEKNPTAMQTTTLTTLLLLSLLQTFTLALALPFNLPTSISSLLTPRQ